MVMPCSTVILTWPGCKLPEGAVIVEAVAAESIVEVSAAEVGEIETGSLLAMPPAIGALVEDGDVKDASPPGSVVPVGETPLVAAPDITTGEGKADVSIVEPRPGESAEGAASEVVAPEVAETAVLPADKLEVAAESDGAAVPEAKGSAVGTVLIEVAGAVPVLDVAPETNGEVVEVAPEATPGCSSVPQTSQTTLSAGFIFSQAGQRTMPDAADVAGEAAP